MPTPSARENLIPVQHLSRGPEASLRLAQGPRTSKSIDLAELWSRLRRDVSGEVRFDAGSRGLYAQDASNYLHVPLGVVVPKSSADVAATLAACRSQGAPVVARGGGTALAGQTTNEAVVLDFSKYMHQILELDAPKRRARVEPGVICDDLSRAAAPYGLTWGPKPATHDHCCFGGMLANNCGGMHAQHAGLAVDNVEAMRVLLYDGTELELGWLSDAQLSAHVERSERGAEIFARLRQFRERYQQLIRSRMPQLPRRVSGYNLDRLLCDESGRFNLARALVGSEGTCVTMLEASVMLVDDYAERCVVVLGYDSVFGAGDHVLDVLEFQPLAVEGMDRILYDHVVQKHLPQEKYLGALPPGDAWLLVELGSQDAQELEQRASLLMQKLSVLPQPPRSLKLIQARAQQAHLWKVRESGLGATAFVPGQPDAWPGFEDSAVRPEQLGDYLRDLRELFSKHEYRPSLYGHFGMGCVHCRVDFDLQSAPGIAKYREFMAEAAELVAIKYRGSLSGEHGDGQARGELLEKMFGAELIQAFREFKAIWDPDGKMNPGRLVDARPLDADLRLGADYSPWQPKTHFKFPDDAGSFAHATLRCVGVGKCRRLNGSGDDDTMCPSFMVTREEKHSTRGRAHLLWEMLRGEGTPSRARFDDENVKEALDLCLACKGCKGDCPVNVDIATYKAEFLSHYYQGRARPRHAYAFGYIDRWARLASYSPGLVNLLTHTKGLSRIAKWAAGMTSERAIPTFAPRTFRSWFESHEPQTEARSRVLLWPDTFNNYFYPDTAIAAVEVLEHLGFQVVIPERHLCCGRPLYDYGLLDQAERYLEEILSTLKPHIESGLPMVVLEPSCASVFRDEMPALMPDRALAKRLTEQTLLLSELLIRHELPVPSLERSGVAQGHCHHKAVLRFGDERSVFTAMGLRVQLLESGCCGLAGSFGFERGKYQISKACGERALLPAVREQPRDALILADGFSCRTQIEQGTERRALHLSEVLKLALDEGPKGPDKSRPPEAKLVERRERAMRQSMWRAAAGLSLLVLGAGLLGWALKSRA